MSLFDTDLNTIDTDIFKFKYNASSASAYRGYDMVKMRAKGESYNYTSLYPKKYFIVYSIEKKKIYIITIMNDIVLEKEMKFNNLSAFDINCVIQQYADKLLNEASLKDPNKSYSIEFY